MQLGCPARCEPYPQAQVPAQGLLFWQLKITLLLPQNVLQALIWSGQEAHFSAAAGEGRMAVTARRPVARASFKSVFFISSSSKVEESRGSHLWGTESNRRSRGGEDALR